MKALAHRALYTIIKMFILVLNLTDSQCKSTYKDETWQLAYHMSFGPVEGYWWDCLAKQEAVTIIVQTTQYKDMNWFFGATPWQIFTDTSNYCVKKKKKRRAASFCSVHVHIHMTIEPGAQVFHNGVNHIKIQQFCFVIKPELYH